MKHLLKSASALLLISALLLGVGGCTGKANPPMNETSAPTAAPTSPDSDASTIPWVETPPLPPEPDSESEPLLETVGPEPENPLPVGERLIYMEDFEDEALSNRSNEVLASLGWVRDTKENGAYSDNTTSYGIVEKNGSKQLYLNNNKDGGSDSYAIILSEALMGKYHEENYTYQYDILYKSAGNNKRYMALVSDYNGLYYNSFHLRSMGYGNNQIHAGDAWLDYDVEGNLYAANSGEKSIVTKLIDFKYDESAYPLLDISISVRYVVNWRAGNRVYLRVNTEGYDNTGKWILVSRGDTKSDGAAYFKPDQLGGAIALKTGGRMDGYIDNILIWEGIGDEPTDKSAPLLTSKDEGCSRHLYRGTGSCSSPRICTYCGDEAEGNRNHTYAAVDGVQDERCVACKAYRSAVEAGWLLNRLPAYEGGTAAKALYTAGHGDENEALSPSEDSLMMVVSQTNEAEFAAYRKRLEAYGCQEVYTHTADGNRYAQYTWPDGGYVYTYYTASVAEVRILHDDHSDAAPQAFGYTYEKKPGDSTVIYQYGVPMRMNAADTGRINYGMIYVIKLADNSVFVLDGGGYQQFDDAQVNGFMTFLRDITGTRDGEKVKIAAWYISHGHQDHMAGFLLFVKKYHQNLDFDRLIFNLPSANSDAAILAGCGGIHQKLIRYIDAYIRDDDVQYLKIHTGQVFNIADARIEALYTHEDIVSPVTGRSETAGDYNNSSSVIKITLDGKSFLFLGDINQPAMNVLMANNSTETLKCDILQLAHHVINDLSKLYHVTKAPVVLVPQSPYSSTLNATRKKAMNAAKQYVQDDMLFYASDATVGIQVRDGAIVKVYERPIDGGKYGGWKW